MSSKRTASEDRAPTNSTADSLQNLLPHPPRHPLGKKLSPALASLTALRSQLGLPSPLLPILIRTSCQATSALKSAVAPTFLAGPPIVFPPSYRLTSSTSSCSGKPSLLLSHPPVVSSLGLLEKTQALCRACAPERRQSLPYGECAPVLFIVLLKFRHRCPPCPAAF